MRCQRQQQLFRPSFFFFIAEFTFVVAIKKIVLFVRGEVTAWPKILQRTFSRVFSCSFDLCTLKKKCLDASPYNKEYRAVRIGGQHCYLFYDLICHIPIKNRSCVKLRPLGTLCNYDSMHFKCAVLKGIYWSCLQDYHPKFPGKHRGCWFRHDADKPSYSQNNVTQRLKGS